MTDTPTPEVAQTSGVPSVSLDTLIASARAEALAYRQQPAGNARGSDLAATVLTLVDMLDAETDWVDVLFDDGPGAIPGRFVECEYPEGTSIHAGEWIDRADGYWALRIPTRLTTVPDGTAAVVVHTDLTADGNLGSDIIDALTRRAQVSASTVPDPTNIAGRVPVVICLAHGDTLDALSADDLASADLVRLSEWNETVGHRLTAALEEAGHSLDGAYTITDIVAQVLREPS